MGTSLTGLKIKDSYSGLLKTTDNAGIGATAKQLTDGLGTGSPLYLSTSKLGIGVSPSAKLHSSDSTAAQGLFTGWSSSGTNSASGAIRLGNNSSYQGRIDYAADGNTSFTFENSYSSGIMSFKTGGSESMRIESNGRVGIGVTASYPLDIGYSAGSAYFRLKRLVSGSETTMLFGAEADSTTIYSRDNTTGAKAFKIVTGETERMRITSGGDVWIGRDNDAFSDTGYVFFEGGSSYQIADGAATQYLKRLNSDGVLVRYYRDSAMVGSVSVSTTSTAYNTSSDYRLKENVVSLTGALDRVDALKPSRFNFIAEPEKTVDGFLAHEVQEVIPEAVTGTKDAMRDEEYEVSPAVYEEVVHPAEEAVYETIEHPAIAEELDADGNVIVAAQDAWSEEVLVSEAKEEWTEKVLVSEAVMGTRSVPDYQGIDQSKIVPLLVAAIQELKAEVDALKGA